MAYKVKIMPRAKRDFEAIYSFIQADSAEAARKWYLGFKGTIQSLKEAPLRCPVTPEHPDILHLLYGKKPHIYRALYTVHEKKKTIEVLHIRHGARDAFASESLN
jgi:toxin ParE1/3/4